MEVPCTYVEEPTLDSILTYNLYTIQCFFELSSQLEATPRFIFVNNTANSAGSILYGGWVEFCTYIEVNQVFWLSMKHFTFKKLHQRYHLIPQGFVYISTIFLTAVSLTTMSQPILVRHFKYLQLQWDKCLEQYHLQ